MPHTKQSSKVALAFRAIGYFAFTLAGCWLAYILPLFTQNGVYVMLSIWMALGGLISGVGVVTDRWAGEFIGLPLLFTAMAAFAGLTLREAYVGHILKESMGNVLLLVAFASLFVARWRDVSSVYRAAKAAGGRSGRRLKQR